MSLTVSEYKRLLNEHGSLAAVARYLNRDQRNLRRWVKRHVQGIEDKPQIDDSVKLLPYLKKPRTVTDLATVVDRSEMTIHKWLDELNEQGYNLQRMGDSWYLDKNVNPSESRIDLKTTETHLTIGIVSDTHACSRAQQITFLRDFYKRCADKGVTDMYHAGDMLAGTKVYPGQMGEIFRHTEDEQIEYVVEAYPKIKGVTTHVIGGNHCLSFVKDGGADPLVRIALERPDIDYIGPYSGWVDLTDACSMYMIHPMGGPAYAVSYKMQKLIESFEGGRKPNIAVMGHFHQQLYMRVRNVHGIMPCSFEAQTLYLRRKAIQPQIGGVMLSIDFDDDGAIQSLDPKFISYMIPKEHDYE